VDIRNRLAPNCWIVTHSYDFPPSEQMGKGVLFGLLGPWLKPGLDWCGWTDENDQALIVQLVLREFNHRLSAFADTQKNFVHVNTQGTLGVQDWDNEIHANGAGWTKLAQVMNLALLPILDKVDCGGGASK
jgi:hypothetical protein